ncbi:MAG: glycosyltransferase family 4 protein [Aliivibrio sp.]|uniref:glycosyltransferase family 4 protein n=1 Tax=Aliivibrio sp. TaxID=1872443 RepID=UPI001A51123F|nr:glycosyltransferase family 4 protein [Aliivibrio sp.]
MFAFKPMNLMIGTNPQGQGGIATVVNILDEQGLLTRFGVKYVSTHSSFVNNKIFAFLVFFYALLKISAYHIFYKVGIVHIHMASRGSYSRKALVISLCKRFDSKVVIHLHGGGFKDFFEQECSKSKQQKIKHTFNSADSIIVLSTQWKKWVSSIVSTKSKVVIIYNAIPPLALPPKQKDAIPVILFLGKLTKDKGVHDLIEAFSKIAPSNPPCRLVLGGDGDSQPFKQQALALGVADRVEFIGWVSGGSKLNWLAKTSILALPSYLEGFPMGILEAMSANIPVVASNVGGIPDAISHHKEGILISPGNISELTNALDTLLSNDNLRNQYATAAKKKYLMHFSPQIVIPEIEAIYTHLLKD